MGIISRRLKSLSYRLLKPLAYLQIRHPEKYWWDYFIPISLSIILCSIGYFLPKEISIFGKDGLIDDINGLLQMLIGFYIAALAAIATFDRKGLDSPMAGQPIYIVEKGDQRLITRRQFLCLLFGYLSFVGILLFAIGLLSNLLLGNIKFLLPIYCHIYFKAIFLLVYFILVTNMATTTLVGLFYLSYKIHMVNK